MEQWRKYFKGDGKKIITGVIKGGVSTLSNTRALSKVGTVRSEKEAVKPVKIEVTSPIEATVDRAKSELNRIIQEADSAESKIYKKTAKRAATTYKRSYKKRKPDIFSK